MNAEIIAVGSEMLGPVRLDTNSLFLTDQLNALGIEVVGKRIVGDDRERLALSIRHALESAEIVILSGGLGPTEDDVTRDAVASALGVSQAMSDTVLAWIADRFRKFGRTMAENNKRQAMVLNGAEILENPNGTAPGQWIMRDGKIVMLLPGPPREIKPMFVNLCVPKLKAILPPQSIATRHYRVAGMGESDLDQLIAPAYTKYTNPVTTVLAKPGDIDVILRARCATMPGAELLCRELGEQIEALLGDRIYSTNGDSLDAVVGDLLKARRETVATAESCTGGLVATRLTDTAGSSDWFRGAHVVYHDDLKSALLQGPLPDTAVSEATALALANAARERSGATWGIATTGYAGPSGEEPGLVWIAVASATKSEARRFKWVRERTLVRSMAATTALDMLRKQLLTLSSR